VSLTVFHMTINEVDANTTGTDTAEFVEINTGVPGLVLSATEPYALALIDGATGLLSSAAIDLVGTADANGFILIGNTAVAGAQITIADGLVDDGIDAAAILQGTGFAASDDVSTGVRIIDGVVYDTGATTGTFDAVGFTLVTGTAAVNEAGGTNVETDSIQRCGTNRRDATVWQTQTATPGAVNGCL
jgi:hypothetical protein